MNRKSTSMFIFAAGAIIGSAVAWLYAKKYYEKIANDEIESMKEWVARRVNDQNKETDSISPDRFAPSTKPNLKDYAATVSNLGYFDYANKTNTEDLDDEEVDETDRPYVIEPGEFGECDYDEVSLTYYADGVLTDEQDYPIEDVDCTVGEDFASHFGEYEDDSVFIRNELMKIDFEILADQRRFSDLDKNKPYPTED